MRPSTDAELIPCLMTGELLFYQSLEVRGYEDWIGLLLGYGPRALPPAVAPLRFEEARITEFDPWAFSGRRPALEWC